ncbi:uncharacterized protein LOC127794900 [Diospyros lotus]|uniref:uncharacterized protein LOC127794900 n=1 Tax=Diospyros lotus TaxID=55363 RepID=UPI00225A755E|nr:uncharacterized protein LOC127794900 [Diospyros lotus]
MKKLCRKGTVHPSPPLISDPLAFLPAAILTLAAALSPEDKEVLAYLISCSSGNNRRNLSSTVTIGGGDHHPPSFSCSCFGCYMSYWAKWDSSPNRQQIHEIIDVFEEGLAQSKKEKNKRERRKRSSKGSDELKRSESSPNKDEFSESEWVEETRIGGGGDEAEAFGGGDEGEEGLDKGPMKKFVSFIGEKLWSVWA